MKFVFFVLGLKGLKVIKEIPKQYRKFIGRVIIGVDKHIDQDYSKELIAFCQKEDIDFSRENNFDASLLLERVIIVAIGWRWMINTKNLVIVLHDSILPRYRGFNPLVSALINGDKYIGVTALKGEDDYDSGIIYAQRHIEVEYPIKIQNAIKNLSLLYSSLVNELIGKVLNGNLIGKAQNDELATFSLWRDYEDYFIDWSKDADSIKRHIDAVGYPYLGARCRIENEVAVIYDAVVGNDVRIENRRSGKVIFKKNNNFYIVCGTGILVVNEIFTEKGAKFDLKNKFRIRFK